MSKARSLAASVFALAALAACEQDAQPLPFETGDEPVVRTVPAEGATVSSPTGASVQLPAGAVPTGTQVTLTPAPAPATTASGTAAGTHVFQFQPAGTALAHPAAVELRVDGARDDAWLASLVLSTPAGVMEDGSASVDLSSGILRGQIGTLGTVSAMIPEAGAVLTAQPLGASASLSPAQAGASQASAPTRALRGDCGAPGRRCAGLGLEVSQNLLDAVDRAAAIYPRLSGEITITGTAAQGTLVLAAPVRGRLRSGASAAGIPVRMSATATPQSVVTETPGQVVITHVVLRGESGRRQGERTGTLTVNYDGAGAWIRLDHSFQTDALSGAAETITVAARIPLVHVQ